MPHSLVRIALQQPEALMQTDHSTAQTTAPFRRRVFYIPGYDPIHPRRYRELYRKEGRDQAQISGYGLELTP